MTKHVEKAQLTEHLFGRYDFFCVSGRERRKLRLRISKRVLSPESDIPDTQRYKCNDILAKKLRFPQQGSGSRKKMPEFENNFLSERKLAIRKIKIWVSRRCDFPFQRPGFFRAVPSPQFCFF